MTRQALTTSHGGCLKSNKQYVVFRVDASSQIGTGHFMRCLTLALRLKVLEAHVVFLCRYITSGLSQMLSDNGIDLRLLDDREGNYCADELAHAKWLGVTQAQDADSSNKILSDRKWDWLIVDHYALDQRWENQLRNSTDNIMVIDDLADRSHDCDLLLDQNFYLDMNQRYEGKVPEHCRLLLGPQYALLRPQFLDARNHLRARGNKVERVLVFFGGVDVEDYTSNAISALSRISDRDFEVDVVIGDQHPNIDKILKECSRLGYLCHVQTDRMASLITDADIAIGAGGSATWERCALGLPTLVIPVAENQRKITFDAASAGLVYAPEIGRNITETLHTHLLALIENKELLATLSINGMKQVDVNGVSKVVHEMNIK